MSDADYLAPFVSVIVPVLDDPGRVRVCIEALIAQTYPRDRYEIVVVDNGSTDDTREVVARYPVALLVEPRRGSYAARNAGLRRARGEVIALTDADCRPEPRWIEEGMRALDAENAALAGGHVRFVYSRRPSGAEIYDALSNMQQERGIRERQVAKTANLFARVKVFDAIGLFPDTMKSGGDVYWTRRATSEGYRLVYARHAEVSHPTRRLRALLAKQWRVGRGRYDRYRLERATWTSLGTREKPSTPPALKISFMPPSWARLRDQLTQRDGEARLPRLLRVWSVGWLCRTLTAVASISRWAGHRLGSLIGL